MTEIPEYPSNSRKKRASRVTKGAVSERKKPLLMSLGEASKGVWDYILWDVLVPAAKSTLSDIVTNATEMILFGESSRGRTRRDRGKTYVSYSSYYKEGREERRSRRPNRHRFDDVVLETRQDAEEVLTGLLELIENYGVATVADFYDLVGLDGDWADNKFGWDNLARASVSRVRNGYILDLPKPLEVE